jgi:hypothetical protein
MMRWAKLLARILVLVAAWAFLARPPVPHSVSAGGFTVDGRQCLYRVADGRLEYLVILDGNWVRGCDRATLDDTDFLIERADGREFRMRSAAPEAMIIDGHEYRLRDGVVFLVTVHPDGNQCRQVPATFGAGGIPYPDPWPQVRERLGQLAHEFPEVRVFLGWE